MFVLCDSFEIWISFENVVGFVFFNIWCIKCVLNLGMLSVFVLYIICFFVMLSDFVLLKIFIILGLFVGIVFGLILFKFWSMWIMVGLLCLSILSFNKLLWIEWKLKWVVFYLELWLLVGNWIGEKLKIFI